MLPMDPFKKSDYRVSWVEGSKLLRNDKKNIIPCKKTDTINQNE